MQRISRWNNRSTGGVRVGVVLLACVALIAVVGRYPGVMRDAERDASRNSLLSYADREVGGGNGLVGDQAALYVARARIPADSTYHVAVSPAFKRGSELTVPFVESFYTYFLMPRRPTDDAPWVICYGCDLAQYGSRAKVVWESDEGISIVRLER